MTLDLRTYQHCSGEIEFLGRVLAVQLTAENVHEVALWATTINRFKCRPHVRKFHHGWRIRFHDAAHGPGSTFVLDEGTWVLLGLDMSGRFNLGKADGDFLSHYAEVEP